MCGIAGFMGGSVRQENMQATVRAMAATVRHRGEGEGAWIDVEAGVALAHRRLAIIDLSPAGHQPMASPSGRYVLTFNGEIYNFEDLRAKLEATGHHSWRGHSDTEVLLASMERYGIEQTLRETRGMFAFAVWDRSERRLTLARDRMGEKPLYYARFGRSLLFGSEIKVLREHPDFESEIDRDALALYFRHNCIPAPYTIFKGVKKLSPGTFIQLADSDSDAEPKAYWSLREVAESGQKDPFRGSDDEAAAELDKVLREAIRKQMIADVPLGAFLSGGIDSSTVTALMKAESSAPVRSFSIAFEEEGYNEAKEARAVAQHLGTEHTELSVTARESLDVIPQLAHIYDEPFADVSQIPTCVLARLTRRYVTVALSGDAGDELFAGYNRHQWVGRLARRNAMIPVLFRRGVAGAMRSISASGWNSAYNSLESLLPKTLRVRNPGDKIHKLAATLGAERATDIYRVLTSHWQRPETLVRGASEYPTILNSRESWPSLPDFDEQMLFLDSVTYLPDDILVKVDRAAMASTLETRVPFLDPRVIEFAWRLPHHMKVRGGVGKWILRQVLYKYVPRELVERPKMGFAPPVGVWLRGALRPWAEELLSEQRLRNEGFLDPAPIRQLWAEHLSGRSNQLERLWDVLMWQAWLEGSHNTIAAKLEPCLNDSK